LRGLQPFKDIGIPLFYQAPPRPWIGLHLLYANALRSNFKMSFSGMTVSSRGVNGSRLASTRCNRVRGSTGRGFIFST